MASDMGSGGPGDRKPVPGGNPEREPRREDPTAGDREPGVRDRAADRLSARDAECATSYADRVTGLGLQLDLRRRGREYLEAIHNDAIDAGGDTRRNRDEGYRAAAVQAERQGLPKLADEAIASISDDGIGRGVRTEALIDTASQAALKKDPDRVVELIDRIPDEPSWNRAWDQIEDISHVDDP